MNGYERTIAFVNGGEFDRPPFMPLIIEWVARQKGIPYPDFVYKPEVRAQAYLDICEEFDVDCVLPDTDFMNSSKISERSRHGRIPDSRLLRSSGILRIWISL